MFKIKYTTFYLILKSEFLFSNNELGVILKNGFLKYETEKGLNDETVHV